MVKQTSPYLLECRLVERVSATNVVERNVNVTPLSRQVTRGTGLLFSSAFITEAAMIANYRRIGSSQACRVDTLVDPPRIPRDLDRICVQVAGSIVDAVEDVFHRGIGVTLQNSSVFESRDNRL